LFNFLVLSLVILIGFVDDVFAQSSPQAIATFNSIGLYWQPEGGSSSRECLTKYRNQGDSLWKDGFSLWFDGNQKEYRGSLVNLTANTTYEISLGLAGTNISANFTAKTWNEKLPVAKTIYLPVNSSDTLAISDSGTANGYILYTSSPGQTATINVNQKYNYDITVNASYVIIRGLTLKEAAGSGIRIYPPSHDIVIEGNDISGWGRTLADGWGDDDGGIYAYESGIGPGTIKRIIVQRNKIHHPRSDSNNWTEERTATGQGNSFHPKGPQALFWWAIGGNHVVRYNEIYSDAGHYFNDCIGGNYNYSQYGFPNADSDIYGNIISYCWDDAIESDGGNRNVRIWGNYLDRSYVKISMATTSLGPLYIWRNVAGIAQKSPTVYEGYFIKTGGWANYPDNNIRGRGRIYVFHNTILQPLSTSGLLIGSNPAVGNGPTANMYTRNNIFHTRKNSVVSSSGDSSNSFDYDLHNGTSIEGPSGSESHGILGVPVYAKSNLTGGYPLTVSSPGFDDGIRINNFNDNYTGSAPDLGAYENGLPPLEFGIYAYLTSPVTTPTLKPTATQTPRSSLAPTPTVSTSFCKTCSANVPQFSLGNANCDNSIDVLDFYLLRDVLTKLQNDENVTETEKAAVDFDCQEGQTTHIVDLKDFYIWSENYKETF